MYYTVFDPPVTCFSRSEEISAWIRELRSQVSRPEFQDPENRKRLDGGIEEAERVVCREPEHPWPCTA